VRLLRNFMKVTASISRLNQQQVTTIHHPPVKVEGLAFLLSCSASMRNPHFTKQPWPWSCQPASSPFDPNVPRSQTIGNGGVAGKQDFNGKHADARPGIDAPAGKYYLLEMYYWSGS
jgi:hypothetical protein